MIRGSGGDRSAVANGTRVLSHEIKVRITAAAASTFVDRMLTLVEGASRQTTPTDPSRPCERSGAIKGGAMLPELAHPGIASLRSR